MEIPADNSGKLFLVHPPAANNQGAEIALSILIQHRFADPEQSLADLEVNII